MVSSGTPTSGNALKKAAKKRPPPKGTSGGQVSLGRNPKRGKSATDMSRDAGFGPGAAAKKHDGTFLAAIEGDSRSHENDRSGFRAGADCRGLRGVFGLGDDERKRHGARRSGLPRSRGLNTLRPAHRKLNPVAAFRLVADELKEAASVWRPLLLDGAGIRTRTGGRN
jgi:hypothetical protein